MATYRSRRTRRIWLQHKHRLPTLIGTALTIALLCALTAM